MAGAIGEKIEQTVTIIPEKEYPFKIIESTVKQETDIKFSLAEMEGETGTEYQLTVENVRQQAGRYYNIIVLKTDHPAKSELEVRVYGNVFEPKKEEPPASDPEPKAPATDQKTGKKAVPSNKELSGGVTIDVSAGAKHD